VLLHAATEWLHRLGPLPSAFRPGHPWGIKRVLAWTGYVHQLSARHLIPPKSRPTYLMVARGDSFLHDKSTAVAYRCIVVAKRVALPVFQTTTLAFMTIAMYSSYNIVLACAQNAYKILDTSLSSSQHLFLDVSFPQIIGHTYDVRLSAFWASTSINTFHGRIFKISTPYCIVSVQKKTKKLNDSRGS